MSTQGILISGNSNSAENNNTKGSRGRAASAVPVLNLGSTQENRGTAPEASSLSHRVKSPSSKLKSQIISPRFSISKIDPILTSSKKTSNSTTTAVTTPREAQALNRRESSNNLKNLFKPIGTNSKTSNSGSNGTSATMNVKASITTNPVHSNQNGTVKLSSNHMGVNLRTSSHTMSRTNAAAATNNNKAILRSNSSFCNNSFKNGSKVSSTINQPPRSPPPLSHDQRKPCPTPTASIDVDLPSPTLIRTNSKDNLKTKSILAPDFPPAPDNPEKQFIGTDKLAYKIWLKERMKYDKWESAKKLYQTKYAEGNVSACQRIVDRLNAEMEELSKAIREDECKRVFPEEPTKPSEICPNNPKEAKAWQQQKMIHEAWENAFNLFQESMAKGDTAACKKLIDVLQMTIYNPQYKTEQPLAQSNSSVRGSANNPQLTPKIESSDQASKVKFAVIDTPISINNPVQNGLPKNRPKLQPPASWTKPRRDNEDKKLSYPPKSSSDSSVDVTPEQVLKSDRSAEEIMPEPKLTTEVTTQGPGLPNPTSSTSTSSDLIDAIDSVLAELNSNNFFNPTHISS